MIGLITYIIMASRLLTKNFQPDSDQRWRGKGSVWEDGECSAGMFPGSVESPNATQLEDVSPKESAYNQDAGSGFTRATS
jgi:hypothetical protein